MNTNNKQWDKINLNEKDDKKEYIRKTKLMK